MMSFSTFLVTQFLTVVRFSKYSPPKLQYIFGAGDYDLRKTKMLNVLNENLIILKWQNIHVTRGVFRTLSNV